MVEWAFEMPSAAELFALLIADPAPIEWHRTVWLLPSPVGHIGFAATSASATTLLARSSLLLVEGGWVCAPCQVTYQDVTLRLIAENMLLCPAYSDDTKHLKLAGRGSSYVQGELTSNVVHSALPATLRYANIYCCKHNAGALEVIRELAIQLDIELIHDGVEQTIHRRRRRQRREVGGSGVAQSRKLYVTSVDGAIGSTDEDVLFLLYLNSLTWTSGSQSTVLAGVVCEVLDAGGQLLLAHEIPSTLADSARHGVKFDAFFTVTPPELLLRGVYSEIAIPLAAGPWRPTAMLLLAQALVHAVSSQRARPEMKRLSTPTRPMTPKARQASARGRLSIRVEGSAGKVSKSASSSSIPVTPMHVSLAPSEAGPSSSSANQVANEIPADGLTLRPSLRYVGRVGTITGRSLESLSSSTAPLEHEVAADPSVPPAPQPYRLSAIL